MLRLSEAEAERILPRRRKWQDLAAVLGEQLAAHGITTFVREHRFHPVRRWRLDIAWPDLKLGVECEGVGAAGKPGRHQLTQHLHDNCEKHSALAAMGWRLIRVTGKQIRSGHALRWIDAAMTGASRTFDVEWDPAAKARRSRKRRRNAARA